MSLTSSDTLAATDRTQPLKRVPEPASQPEPQIEDTDADDGTQHTVYLAFDNTQPALVPRASEAIEAPHAEATAVRNIAVACSAPDDPAELVQFQALELAATRAELARHEREHEELQRALRLRDSWLADLRKELKAAQEEQQFLTAQLAEARQAAEAFSARVQQQAEQIATLEAQAAERLSMTEFAPESKHTTHPARSAELLNIENPSTLLPLDDSTPPIVLNRKVMTVGRTRDNDVCVASVLVSRDHARLLVSEESIVLFDVGSINGSFVNEQPVKRHTLRDGDVVRFADRRYRFRA